jgi:hypothetical protein
LTVAIRPDSNAVRAPILTNVEPFPVSQFMPPRGLSDAAIARTEFSIAQPSDNQAIRRGVITGFTRVCERWQISRAKQLALLGYADDEFLGAQILAGRTRGGQDVKDRVGYLIAIAIGLRALFNNSVNSELRWLQTPRFETDGKPPIDYMTEGRMINLMRARELVDHERGL